VQALERLREHPWQGNVRELQNVIERALILAEEDAIIGPEHLWLLDEGDGAWR
jgi:DNA-binding NtrC family response regulator